MNFRAYLTLLSLSVVVLVAWPFDICHGASAESLSVSAQIVGGEFSYVVKRGDSLTSIGARFSVSTSVLAGANGLPLSARLQVGQELRVDNRHIVPGSAGDGIVINIPQRMLFFFKEGRLRHAYPVALGKPDWPTPTGQFKIAVKEENPVWDVPKSIQEELRREGKVVKTCVPPGPDNPLGKHWLGLSAGGYGIHGTIAPSSIYHFQTHGCIRLHPDDIAELFGEISRGTPAILVYRRLLVAQIADRIFLEVHRDIYQKQPAITQEFEQLLRAENLEVQIDWPLANDIMRQQDGIARDITKKTEPQPPMKLEPPRQSQLHQDPKAKMTQVSRRKFLGIATWTLAMGLLPRQASSAATSGTPSEKALAFYNTHTGERLRTVYWAQGNYIGESLGDINRILRDHLANEIKEIDPSLLDLLFAIRTKLETSEAFHIISGYRSPATNTFLRANSSGVAVNSLHTVGKAMDIRTPGRDLRALHKIALALRGGGVGYYPKSDFVHVDVGRVRNW